LWHVEVILQGVTEPMEKPSQMPPCVVMEVILQDVTEAMEKPSQVPPCVVMEVIHQDVTEALEKPSQMPPCAVKMVAMLLEAATPNLSLRARPCRACLGAQPLADLCFDCSPSPLLLSKTMTPLATLCGLKSSPSMFAAAAQQLHWAGRDVDASNPAREA